MALDAEALALDIKSVLEGVSSTSVESEGTPSDPQGEISSSITSLADGIAAAVVSHIKENLEVKVQGTGYAGFTVISDSETGAGTIS